LAAERVQELDDLRPLVVEGLFALDCGLQVDFEESRGEIQRAYRR
jgi:hypothetical protein